MKMEVHEDSCDSFPYIDDSLTDEESAPHQYNLKISENYQNKNRNIEITNRLPNDVAQHLTPVAPLAEEQELNDFQEEAQKQMKNLGTSGVKLVIKGWHSSISIQGLDNKSSITFKRRCEKLHRKESRNDERMTKANVEESKPKRGRWKMLTKSLMLARSARFERRGLDERYPKYVLLKNEDDEMTTSKDNYPKMFVFNEGKQKKNAGFKSEFNLKKSFRNKTEPIVSLEKILSNTEKDPKPKDKTQTRQKQPLTERCRKENRNVMIKKRVVMERRKNVNPEDHACSDTGEHPLTQGFVCNEIQGIFEDTLKLLPESLDLQQPDKRQNDRECCSSVPPQYCHFPCHDPYYCLEASNQTSTYLPVYSPPKHTCRNTHTQTGDKQPEEQNLREGDLNLENLPFGLLSSFFPRVVIMKTIQSEDPRSEMTSNSDYCFSKCEAKDPKLPKEDEGTTFQSLQIPQQDLTLKSKIVSKPEPDDSVLKNVSKESSSSDEEVKTTTQESEATTEYFQYSEFPDSSGNEAIDKQSPQTLLAGCESGEKTEKIPTLECENSDNMTLTKIGYKMYDNLTKLSLNREKETAEASGCGCNGNKTKKSPYNITFESSGNSVKVTVPENNLNFQIVNSQGADIQIGLTSSEERIEEEEQKKTIVRREELWHSDGGGRALVLKNDKNREEGGSGACFSYFPIGVAIANQNKTRDTLPNSANSNELPKKRGKEKLKLSLVDNKDVVLSIEMNERDKKEEKAKEKRTKEMKVGTDDFDLAGGDFAFSGGNHRNLSPRIGRLLKHLHDKLESDERERRFLDEKINQKLLEPEGVLPGVFLVKHISPRNEVVRKLAEVPLPGNAKKAPEGEEKSKQLREYYCEECLATMRIFEDENPSVKSMVDKFETIIQLESF